MKTTFKFASFFALMFTVAVGMANEPLIKLDSQSGGRSLIFTPGTDLQGSLIKFMDADGHRIYFDNVGINATVKRFDLTRLDEGTYLFILENSLKKTTYTLHITGGKVKISDPSEKDKPIFRQKGERVFLNLLNLDRNKVMISVLDSSNRLLYKQVLDDSLLVEKAFNFENAFQDSYTIVVKDNKDSYYENVDVK